MNCKVKSAIMSLSIVGALGLSVYASMRSTYDENSVITINIATTNTTSSESYQNEECITCMSDVASDITTANTEKVTETKAETESILIWININTATAEELEALDGIGSVIAARIVEYRISHDYFRNIEEIMKVEGIGEGKFEAIKDQIYVENPVYDITVEESTLRHPEGTSEATFTDVPTIEEETAVRLEDVAPININTATEEELMLLPYVDDAAAKSIIELRESIGSFNHVYELLYVEELEQKEVAEIIEFVTVGQLP